MNSSVIREPNCRCAGMSGVWSRMSGRHVSVLCHGVFIRPHKNGCNWQINYVGRDVVELHLSRPSLDISRAAAFTIPATSGMPLSHNGC